MNRRDTLIAGVLVVVLLAMLLPLARIGVDAHHDGVMFKPALDVLTGHILFRDSFMQYGAMTCYLQVMALALQRTLLSLRLLTVAAYAGSLVFMYAAWRQILPRSLAFVAGILFILFIPAYEKDYWNDEYWMLLPWSSVFAMLFQGIGLYALFRVIRSEQPVRWGLVLGMACASVFWCRQPVGGMMIVTLIVVWPALIWTGWRPAGQPTRPVLGGIVGGFVVVNALLLGWIALTGALTAWWYQNVIWPGRWSESIKWGDTLPLSVHPATCAGLVSLGLAAAAPGLARRFRPDLPRRLVAGYLVCLGALLVWQHARVLRVVALREGGWSALLPLAILVQAALSVRLAFVSRGVPRPTEYYLIASLAALALGSLLQYYPIADSWHIFYSLAPTFGLFVYGLWRWTGWPAAVVATVLLAAFLPSIWGRVRAIPPAVNRPLVTLEKPAILRGMRVPPEQARSLGLIADALGRIMRQQPDIPSAMIGNNALYLCLTNNQDNPTPYYVTWRGLASQPDNLQRWQYISAVRPMLILQQARWDAVNDFYHRSRYVPLLYVPEEALEIAVPAELARAMGLGPYGLDPGLGTQRSK